jgi:hypothetical protein
MLGHDNYQVHICAGLPPLAIENESKLSKTIFTFNNVLRVLTLLINVIIFVRIQTFKHIKPTKENVHQRSKFSWLVKFENKILSDFTSNIVTAICMPLIGVSQIQTKFVNFSEINLYPYYLYEYFYTMVRAPLMFHLIIVIFYVRNNQLRKTIFRELQLWWSDSFSGQKKMINCNV